MGIGFATNKKPLCLGFIYLRLFKTNLLEKVKILKQKHFNHHYV